MAEKFANDAYSPLAADIDGSQTTLTVTSATKFPTTGNFRLRIEDEYLLCTGVSGTTFTVTRGIESSTATSHVTGKRVTQVVTSGALAQFAADAVSLIAPKRGTDLTNGNQSITVSVSSGNTFVMPAGVQTADRTITLNAPTDASKPWVVLLVNQGTTFNLLVANGGTLGDTMTSIGPGCAGSYVWDASTAAEGGFDWNPGGYWVLP
jgi:hypothetical protein